MELGRILEPRYLGSSGQWDMMRPQKGSASGDLSSGSSVCQLNAKPTGKAANPSPFRPYLFPHPGRGLFHSGSLPARRSGDAMAALWPSPVHPSSSRLAASVPCGARGSRDPPLSAHIHVLCPCVPIPDSPPLGPSRTPTGHSSASQESLRRGWLCLCSSPAVIYPEYKPMHTSPQSSLPCSAPRDAAPRGEVSCTAGRWEQLGST